MRVQATDERTLSRAVREETAEDGGSGMDGPLTKRQDEHTAPESDSAGRNDVTRFEQDRVEHERDPVATSPSARSRFFAVLAEIGRWRADVLK